MINDNLKRAVADKNISRIRAIVLRQINSDRNKSVFGFVESCNYAEQSMAKDGLSFFDVDNGESLVSDDGSDWSKESWQDLRIEFEYNFSKNKMERIVSIMNYLRKQGELDFMVEDLPNSSNSLPLKVSDVRRTTSLGESKDVLDVKTKSPSKLSALDSQQERSRPKLESEQQLSEKTNRGKVLAAGLGCAVLGGVIASFARLTLAGVVIGAIVGVGIGLASKKSKD